jgi:type I restriction enzyme, S subunit
MSFSEWKKYKLNDALEALIDYRGKTPKKTTFGIPLITAKIVKSGFIEEPNEFIAEEDYDSWMVRGFPKVGDVVLTTEAPLGEVAQIKNARIALAQRIVTLRGKKGVLDNSYLKYFLFSKIGQHRLKERETGTTVSGIKQSELRLVEIDCPSYENQITIGNILSSLDDAIELNQQINKTLEEVAKTIFKEWFVDFNFPNATGEFKDSEIGEIPVGWKVYELGDLIDTISETYRFGNKEKIIFLNTGDISEGEFLHRDYSEIHSLPGQAKKTIKHNDILFSEIRPANKRYAFVNFDSADYVVSTKLMVLRTKKINPLLIYFFLTREETLKELQHLAESRSGTFPQITFTQLKDLKIVLPTGETLDKFITILEGYYSQSKQIIDENQTLINLRDTLLPKLMKGEIEMKA